MNLKALPASSRQAAFTLTEVLIASTLAAISLGGIIYGYLMSARRAEWSAYHLAAHSLAMQRLEQARAAKWDLSSEPEVDNLVAGNFPETIETLDVPISGTNVIYATNVTTILTVSTSPPLKMIRVDCSWQFPSGRAFTNTVATFRAKDQ